MADSFRNRAFSILDRLAGYELDAALKEYNSSTRSGASHKRAFDRLGRLSSALFDFGRIGRRIAEAKGIPTDDEWEDQLPGGKADGKSPSDFDEEALQEGAKVELEHTDDYDLALEVATDHLEEFPSYYEELGKMEKKLKEKESTSDQEITDSNPNLFTDPLSGDPANDELTPTDKTLNAPKMLPNQDRRGR